MQNIEIIDGGTKKYASSCVIVSLPVIHHNSESSKSHTKYEGQKIPEQSII